MMDMYGLAALYFQESRKGEAAWYEDDAIWRMPSIFAAAVAGWSWIMERTGKRADRDEECSADDCRTAGA